MNSAIEPRIASYVKEAALDPKDVAKPFAASFAPIEKDIKKLNVIVSSNQIIF